MTKEGYATFFTDLISEIQSITTEKSQKIAALEQRRINLAQKAGQNHNLQRIYCSQQEQLLKAAQLIGCG